MKTSNIIIVILLVIIYRLKTGKTCHLRKWLCGENFSLPDNHIEFNPIPREEPSSFTGTKMSDLNDKYV